MTLKDNQKLSFLFNEDNINDSGDISKVQLMRAGEFHHGFYGSFDITPETFLKMQENFKNDIRKVELAVDYFHDSCGIAAGWIKEIILENDNTELWIVVEWTPEGERRIRDKELRYLSADFTMNHTDIDEKGEDDFSTFGATLFGAGLTNRPFIKGMNKILSEDSLTFSAIKENLISQGIKFSIDFDSIVEVLDDLTEDEKGQIIQMLGGNISAERDDENNGRKSQMSEEAKKLSDVQAEVTKLSESLATLTKSHKEVTAENVKLKREQEFTALLSEGKVVPAQKNSYMENDMAKFAADAVNTANINLDEKGSESGGDEGEEEADTSKTKEEAEEKVVGLAQAKLSADSALGMGDAISLVLSENPQLAKLYEGDK